MANLKTGFFLAMVILLCSAVFNGCVMNPAENVITTMQANEPIIIEENVELVELQEGVFSVMEAVYLTMKQFDKNIIFNCAVDSGGFFDPVERIFIKNISAYSGDIILWSNLEVSTWVNHAYIEIILELDKNLIGYVVIAINIESDNKSPVFLKSVLFPEIDGEYQNVSEEYVKAAIEKVKDENR